RDRLIRLAGPVVAGDNAVGDIASARRRGLALPYSLENGAGFNDPGIYRRAARILRVVWLHLFEHDFGQAVIVRDAEIDPRTFAGWKARATPGRENLDGGRFVRFER